MARSFSRPRRCAYALVLGAILGAGCGDEVTPPGGEGGAGGGSFSTSSGAGGANTLVGAKLGNPELLSAQAISFGPGGVLLVGDGRSDRIVALETGDTSSAARPDNTFNRVENVTGQTATLIGDGATAAELVVSDIAVNPISWRTYVAVTRITTNEAFILWVEAGEGLRMFDLDNVVHATVHVPPGEGSSATMAGVVWTDEHAIASLTPPSFNDHELAYVGLPFEHEGGARHATTRVFHRSFDQWLSDVPLDRFFTYEHEGKLFVVGSFTSSIARFESSALERGASEEPGDTVFDIQDGRMVLDWVRVDQEDDFVVYATLANLEFDGEPGGLKIDSDLFTQTTDNNGAAPTILSFTGSPIVSGVERAPAIDGAQRLALQGDDHAVMLGNNRLTTEELEPPVE